MAFAQSHRPAIEVILESYDKGGIRLYCFDRDLTNALNELRTALSKSCELNSHQQKVAVIIIIHF